MRLARLILITIFIMAILAAPSFAATKTITYTHTIPSAKTDWDNTHTLPLFNPALGKLIRVDFTETLNATMFGQAENLGPSVAKAFLSDHTDMYAVMIDGVHLDLSADLREPPTGLRSIPVWDNVTDWFGTDYFNITLTQRPSKTNTYTLPAKLALFIASSPGETKDFLVNATGYYAAGGSGNFQNLIETWAGSDANITYYYDDSHCLSGYKLDGCTNTGLSGWTITVNNSTNSWPITTDGDGFWQKCGLDNDTYTICETPQLGWTQTAPSSPICYTKTIDGANITDLNFTNEELHCINGHKYNACNGLPLEGWQIEVFTSPPYVTVFNITGPIWNRGCNDACCRKRHKITDQCLEENQ